jgi:hypothetical protein
MVSIFFMLKPSCLVNPQVVQAEASTIQSWPPCVHERNDTLGLKKFAKE